MFSSWKSNKQGSYPDVPDSLRPDAFEMRSNEPVMTARADTVPYMTPYLGLRARLSQIWINRWTVLLLLVLVRVILLIVQLEDNTGDAKLKALSACTKVEDIGSSMASMPHYLSAGVNDAAAKAIDLSVRALVDTLDLMLDGVEAIIIFFINFLTATYTCLLTAMVHGTLDVVGNVTESATDAFNDVVNKAAKEIDDLSGDLQDAINKLTGSIEKSIIGDLIPDIPKVNFSEPVSELESFKLDPDDFVKDVQQLNDNIPSFEEVQNLTKQAVSYPFNLVKKALNDSYGDYSFDRNVFPLAQKQQLTFCSNNDTINDFFKGLYDLIHKARTAFLAVLIIAAILAIAPMAYFEILRWRRQQRHAKLAQDHHYDSMDVVYIASRPLTASAGIKFASRFHGKRQVLVRWCIAYATSPAALFVLSLALAGFFSVLCQYILLKAVQKEVPAIADQVGDFAHEVVSSLHNVSQKWADDVNGVISGLNDDINKDVLDYVVNATDAVNDTMTTFLDTMNDGLEEVFNGTILLGPIQTVLHCVIGIKIESLQHGLTWVHDHAHVSLPLFGNDTFSFGANESVSKDSDMDTFLSSPTSVTTDEVSGAVKHVVNWLVSNMIQDAYVSLGILFVYIIVVLMGVSYTLAGMATPDRGRAEGGLRYVDHHQAPLTPRLNPQNISVDTRSNPFADPATEKNALPQAPPYQAVYKSTAQ